MDVNQEKQPFERIEVSREQALKMFSDNSFKASKAANFYIKQMFVRCFSYLHFVFLMLGFCVAD